MVITEAHRLLLIFHRVLLLFRLTIIRCTFQNSKWEKFECSPKTWEIFKIMDTSVTLILSIYIIYLN